MAEIDAEELAFSISCCTSKGLRPGDGSAVGDVLAAAEAHLAHLRAPKEARADSRDVCWHCRDALIPEPPPHCESCPDYECGCDDKDCEAEGCLEREEKHRAALSRARGA